MCGRYTFEPDAKLYSQFRVNKAADKELPLSFNVTPGSLMPVITADATIKLMKWGLIPFWADDPKIGFRLINARSETVAVKPAFKTAFKSRRCLIPATGFYEWQKTNGKIPYYFYSTSTKYLPMAGLYDSWQDAGGKQINSYTIITTPANPVVSSIHNRMPAILLPGEEGVWLNQNTDPNQAQSLLRPFEGTLTAHPVNTAVNRPDANGQELIRPLS